MNTHQKHQWQARWVWVKDSVPDKNIYACFRKTFKLQKPPAHARCYITAERWYRLWVNGKPVGQGPVWEDPEERSYDTHDVLPLLKQGKNVLAVLVHMQFDESGAFRNDWRRNYVTPSRPGLFCELDIAGARHARQVIATDESWKARRSRAWHEDAPFRNDLSMQEWYDFAQDPADWNDTTHDDSDWPHADVIGDADGNAVTGGFLPWRRLVPRRFPFLRTTVHRPVRVRSGEILEWIGRHEMVNPAVQMTVERIRPLQKADVKGDATLLTAKGNCQLRGSDPHESLAAFDGVRAPTIVLDFGRVMNAHLNIEFESEPGSILKGEPGPVLDIGYAESLLEEEVRPYRSDRGANADRLLLASGRCAWRTLEYRPFRYVQLTLRGSRKPLTVYRVFAEEVTHSWPREAKFKCSDKEFERLWDATVATVRHGVTDRMPDNTVREHRQYLHEFLPAQAVYGDAPFFHHYFRQIFKHRNPDGSFLACVCPGWNALPGQLITAEHYQYAGTRLWEHCELFGEKDFLREFWDGVQATLAHWHRQVNSRGMLYVGRIENSTSEVGDWGFHEQRGEHAITNGLFLEHLRCATQMARLFNDQKLERLYRSWAQPVERNLRSNYWNEEKAVFVETLVDGQQSELATEHAVGLMLELGLAKQQQVDRLVRAWTVNPDLVCFSETPGVYRIVEGLIRYGYAEFALQFVRRMGMFLDQGLGSFGEVYTMLGRYHEGYWDAFSSRSVAQSSSAWPALFFGRHVAGVQPQLASRGLVRLAPLPILEWVEASAFGVYVRWEFRKSRWILSARFRRPEKVELVLPFPVRRIASVTVNGNAVGRRRNTILVGPQQSVEIECKLRPETA